MALVVLPLSVCVLTLIQLTSSQTTYDFIQQDNYDNYDNYDNNNQQVSHPVTVDSQLQTTESHPPRDDSQIQKGNCQVQTNTSQLPKENLTTVVSEIQTAVAQLQRDFAEMKARWIQDRRGICSTECSYSLGLEF